MYGFFVLVNVDWEGEEVCIFFCLFCVVVVGVFCFVCYFLVFFFYFL